MTVALRGVRTDGAMAADIPLTHQRPAEYMFSRHVEHKLEEIRNNKRENELVAAK
jgi:hypothetical protein